MKKIRLLELINSLDDEIIENVLEIDTPQKLKEKKSEEKIMKRNYKKLFAGLACAMALIIGIGVGYNETKKQNEDTDNDDENVTIASPMMECSTLEEMNSLLDFEVPALDKDVELYVALDYDGDGHGEHGRIMYSDGSQFEMEETIGDISGIYGSELIKTETIDGMEVQFYSADEFNYISWNDGTYSYSYSVSDRSLSDSEVVSVVNLTK